MFPETVTYPPVPRPRNEAVRLEALRDIGILDTPPDPIFDRLTLLAATIFEAPIAFVSFVDESREWMKSGVGVHLVETPRDVAFCAHTILSSEVMVVLDPVHDPRFELNPFVIRPGGVRFYAGAPIITADGQNIGALCVLDTKSRASFSRAEEKILRLLADLAFDAIESHKARAELQTSAEEARDRYALVARATLDGVWDWDIKSGAVYYSLRWQTILGLLETEHAANLAHWLDRVHAEDRLLVETDLQKHLDGETSRFRSEHRVRHEDGSWRWVVVRGVAARAQSGEAIRMAGSLMDLTDVKTCDPLTGLPNRLLLHERLAKLIRRSEETHAWHFAVLFLDIDHFKRVNDQHGHLVGDAMLKSVADRLSAFVVTVDTESMVSRYAGDEFVILLDGVKSSMQVRRLVMRLHAALEDSIDCVGERLIAGVSIGIAMAQPDLKTPEAFLYSSDMAMYRAKANGRGSSVFFDPVMRGEMMERLETESALRESIPANQLRICYQPQIALDTGRLVGCEALIRWQHPRRGLLLPNDFIKLAEETGIVSQLDLWVMETACHQLAEWRRLDAYSDLKMSVNVSGQHLARQELKEIVQDVLARNQLPAASLCIEITESMLMLDLPGSIYAMNELRLLGIGLHMDDFGSGYSSFKHLYELPFDTVKIDQSFMRKLPSDQQALKVVEGIVRLAHTMGLRVTAEGIETIQQFASLREMGCDLGQGYYFARPLSASRFQAKYLGGFHTTA